MRHLKNLAAGANLHTAGWTQCEVVDWVKRQNEIGNDKPTMGVEVMRGYTMQKEMTKLAGG